MGNGLPNEIGWFAGKSPGFFAFLSFLSVEFVRQGVCERASAYAFKGGVTV
jgi:hypothetical protein